MRLAEIAKKAWHSCQAQSFLEASRCTACPSSQGRGGQGEASYVYWHKGTLYILAFCKKTNETAVVIKKKPEVKTRKLQDYHVSRKTKTSLRGKCNPITLNSFLSKRGYKLSVLNVKHTIPGEKFSISPQGAVLV